MKRLRNAGWVALLCLLPAGTVAHAQSIEIGHTNCLAVAGYSQALMNEIGQLKWYFAHASVGGNMIEGLADLHSSSPGFYTLSSASAGASPSGVTPAGVVAEYNRGNPGWQAKVDTFQTCVSNGWRCPQVNLVLNKFCYIDQTADLAYYLRSMTNLEAAFPETVFVHMTLPLMTSEDNDNYLRNVFNDGLRSWVRTNSRVLYDIADIEAHDNNGVVCTFVFNSRVCQKMYSAWSSDGGHLNADGRQLVARGFYALSAALLQADRDGDGLTDGRELIAGTRPSDAQSVFMLSATEISATRVVLQWSSVSNRYYTLQRGTNLLNPADFANLLLNTPAVPPVNVWTDSPPTGDTLFYRVRVRQ